MDCGATQSNDSLGALQDRSPKRKARFVKHWGRIVPFDASMWVLLSGEL